MIPWLLMASIGCDPKQPCAEGFGADDSGRCVPIVLGADDTGSASVNTAPTAPALSVIPANPREGGVELTCSVAVESVDIDGDDVEYAVAWTSTAGSEVDSATVDGAALREGDEWTCTVTPTDGIETGPSGTASVVVGAPIQPWEHDQRSLSESDYLLLGENPGDGAGGYLARAGDVDGDGRADFLVGSYWNDEAGEDAGKAYLMFGASLGAARQIELADADWHLIGENGGEPPCEEDEGSGEDPCEGDWTAHSVNTAGDVDGDGLDDLLVCGYRSDETAIDAGKVFLVPGHQLGREGGRFDLSDAPTHFLGEASMDMLGHSVTSAGDVDGDGLDDIVMGAYGHDDYTGTAYVVLASSLESEQRTNMAEADFFLEGEQVGDEAGYFTAPAGDVDGDGLDDIMTAALLNKEAGDAESPTGQIGSGKLYIVTAEELPNRGGTLALGDVERAWLPEGGGDLLGYGTQGMGDVDGDGLADLVVGAFGNDEQARNAGKAYVATAADMGSGGTRVLEEASYGFLGEQEEHWAGFSASLAGDVDLDGVNDLIVGAFRYGVPSERKVDIGKAYLIRMGRLDGTGTHHLEDAHASWVGEAEGDAAGYRVSGAGDLNGDGMPDLLVSGWQGDMPSENGKVWVLLNP